MDNLIVRCHLSVRSLQFSVIVVHGYHYRKEYFLPINSREGRASEVQLIDLKLLMSVSTFNCINVTSIFIPNPTY